VVAVVIQLFITYFLGVNFLPGITNMFGYNGQYLAAGLIFEAKLLVPQGISWGNFWGGMTGSASSSGGGGGAVSANKTG
jgi:hypothetical protein